MKCSIIVFKDLGHEVVIHPSMRKRANHYGQYGVESIVEIKGHDLHTSGLFKVRVIYPGERWWDHLPSLVDEQRWPASPRSSLNVIWKQLDCGSWDHWGVETLASLLHRFSRSVTLLVKPLKNGFRSSLISSLSWENSIVVIRSFYIQPVVVLILLSSELSATPCLRTIYQFVGDQWLPVYQRFVHRQEEEWWLVWTVVLGKK